MTGTAVTRIDEESRDLGPPMPTSAGVIAAEGETSAASVAARAKAEVEARAIVAMHRPRDIHLFRRRLLDACRRPRFAETARYSKPVGGARVEGLSIRFAEEAARLFGNIVVSSTVVFDSDDVRILKVTATDLETNAHADTDVTVAKTVERSRTKPGDEVLRSRTNSRGLPVHIIRADDDALLNKQNALVSKARRNVILTLIPSDIKEEAEEVALDTVQKADAEDPAAARKRLLDAFYSLGVMPSQVEEFIGHPVENITPAEIQMLRAVFTAIRDGEATFDEALAQKTGRVSAAPEGNGTAKGTAGLTETLRRRSTPKTPEPSASAPDGE